MRFDIPDDVTYIIEKIEESEHEAFIVGGCVRDCILNRTPKDWDITTSAMPEQVIGIFANERVIPTGVKHGTVSVLLHDTLYEITTYRVDGKYENNRCPSSVEFVTSIHDDLQRRDFTINAIAYNHNRGLVDPFNGADDIYGRIIRCVGEASKRFSEDALRILRAWRFQCQLGFDIDPDTVNAMYNQLRLLDNISVERIQSEFIKIVNSDNFIESLNSNDVLLEYILPEFKDMKFEQKNPYHIYNVYNHTLKAFSEYIGNDLVIKLAILLHDIGKPKCYVEDDEGVGHFYEHAKVGAAIADRTLRRLKFDNETREKVIELISYHDATIPAGKRYVKRWLNKIGENQLRRLVDLRKADVCAQNPLYKRARFLELNDVIKIIEEVLAENECFTLKDLKVNGRDLISIGYKPGKYMGEVLAGMLNGVINGTIMNEKECLLEEAITLLKQE